MKQKQLKAISINNVEFTLDHRYQLIVDLVSPELDHKREAIERIFVQTNSKLTKMLIDQAVREGYIHDIAFTYFLIMAYQNLSELKKADKLISELYRTYPENLLVKIAYAGQLYYFLKQPDKILQIFDNTFDLEKITVERTIPLIVFMHYMSLICNYYLYKNNRTEFMKYLSYMIKADPTHPETTRFLEEIHRDKHDLH